MALEIKNTKDLIDPDKLKLKILLIGPPGVGKTAWMSEAPNPGIAACETGAGNGLQTVAKKGLSYVTPTTLPEFEAVCSGKIFEDKETIVLDSLTEMTKTFIKDAALAVPRAKGNSAKRQRGIPELDDYGTIAEFTRRLLNNLIGLDKHIVATATMKIKEPDAATGQGAFLIGPDLPGMMFMAAPAMFDLVIFLKTRRKLRDPKDAKSRYTERFLITDNDNVHLAKSRYNEEVGKALLDPEEIIDLKTGKGSFNYIFKKIQEGYRSAAVQ